MKKTITTIISVFMLLIAFSGCSQTEKTNTNDNYEISAIITHDKIEKNEPVKIIDVRTPEEYDQQHLSNSTLIPLDSLATEISKMDNVNKSDEIIVYCRSGRRSAEAYEILASIGYTNVKSMAGGITAWTSLGYNVCLGASLTC